MTAILTCWFVHHLRPSRPHTTLLSIYGLRLVSVPQVSVGSRWRGSHHPLCCWLSEGEAKVFDKAIQDICNVHWKDTSFDSFPVITVPIPCLTVTTTVTMKRCTHCWKVLFVWNLRIVVVSGSRFTLKHMDGWKNEVTFRKCDDSLCQHCSSKSVQCLSF